MHQQKVLETTITFDAESDMKIHVSVLTFSINDHAYPAINIGHRKSATISPIINQVCLKHKSLCMSCFAILLNEGRGGCSMTGTDQENASAMGHNSVITFCLTSHPLCPAVNYISKTNKNRHRTITALPSGYFGDCL